MLPAPWSQATSDKRDSHPTLSNQSHFLDAGFERLLEAPLDFKPLSAVAVTGMRGYLHSCNAASNQTSWGCFFCSTTCSTRCVVAPFSSIKPAITSISCCSSSCSLLDHLILTIDGFVAQKATATFPGTTQVPVKPLITRNLQIIQSLVPARTQGQLFSAHPQLLVETDMQSWLDFLTSFGFTNTQIAEILGSTPEVFYSSTVFQARGCGTTCD